MVVEFKLAITFAVILCLSATARNKDDSARLNQILDQVAGGCVIVIALSLITALWRLA